MRFSILIPVYNTEKYLRECIESVINQTYDDYEIILVDDGSTDDSGLICDEYRLCYPNLINVIHKSNEGLLFARREAFRNASGDYYICLDSDDLLKENALNSLSSIIDSYYPDVIQYDLYLMYSNGSICNINSKSSFCYNEYNEDTLRLKNCLLDLDYNVWSMCGKCIKNKCIEKNKSYEMMKHIAYGEDLLQTIEIYDLANSFYYTDGCIYLYRIKSGMTKKLPEKYCKDFYEISVVLVEAANRWGLEYVDSRISRFMLYIFLAYIIDMSKTRIYKKDIKNTIEILISKYNYTMFFSRIQKNKAISSKMGIKKILLSNLIARKKVFFMYILLRINYYTKYYQPKKVIKFRKS